MAKKKAPQIVEVRATAFVNGPTDNVAALRSVLDAVAADATIEPTHGGRDDRTREEFDAAALASATSGPSVWIWRRKRPQYWGAVDTLGGPVARASVFFERIGESHVPAVCEAMVGLMDRLKPAYGAMHFAWSSPTPEHVASMTGLDAKAIDYCEFGPPGVFAWTWFGPALAEQIGQGAIVAAGGQRRPWGGILLALGKRPWEVPFEDLRAAQKKVDKALRAKGYFGDHEFPGEAAPKWERPV